MSDASHAPAFCVVARGDLPALQDRLGAEQPRRPAEPAGGDVRRLQGPDQQSERHERERHDVAADHPLLVLEHQPSADGSQRQTRCDEPGDSKPCQPHAEDPPEDPCEEPGRTLTGIPRRRGPHGRRGRPSGPSAREQTVSKGLKSAILSGVYVVGWMTGFEPATSGATVRRSTTELHPPLRGKIYRRKL
jgi:hypothetical protein